MCDVSFPNLPALSRGLGLFLFLAALSRPSRFGGVEAAQPRGAASERSLLPAALGVIFLTGPAEAEAIVIIEPGTRHRGFGAITRPGRVGELDPHRGVVFTDPTLPAAVCVPHAPGMFVVSETESAAIRVIFDQQGELSAAMELRRLFPAITDNAQARECARTIAGWKPLPGGGAA
jgi:hypothetical protein